VLVGMVHVNALPGSPRFEGDLAGVREAAVRDAKALTQGGAHGIMMENFGDAPFYPGRVPAEVVAHMTAIACAVRSATDLPLGINVLRNDGESALAIAHACHAQFIRVNVLCSVRVADQGLLHGIAHDLMRLRSRLGATDIEVWADVDVKHSAPLAKREIEDEVDDMIARGLADVLICSGAGTGKGTDPKTVARVKRAAGGVPVVVGSGVTESTIGTYDADGFVIGTALKRDGQIVGEIDVDRVRSMRKAMHSR
jgi:membrane complex biogenesis BtpA family protein